MNRLAGKTAFLTAAGAGIGRATAEAFAAEGARVIATDLNAAGLAGLNAETRTLDVRSTEAVQAMAREVGPVDILFNCAGFVHHGTALDTSDEDWDFSFDLNVKSMHRTIRAFLPGMIAKGGGSIVNIASGASSVRGIPNRYVYGASKAAVIQLTKSMALEWARYDIRVNALCPGYIETPINRDFFQTEAGKALINRIPSRRLGLAEELDAPLLLLASGAGSYMTGSALVVDGGHLVSSL